MSGINIDNILTIMRAGGQRSSWKKNLMVMIASVLFFIAVGFVRWSATTVVIITVALLLHEVGHLAAMRILRYSNIKMFFIPFIGGIASGDSKEENITNNSLIIMSGPLFGIISAVIAAGLYSRTGIDMLLVYARVALLINVINLLPIFPLDGGRLLNDLVFARSSRLEVGFKLMTGAALIVGGVVFRELILVFIGAVVVFSLPDSIKATQILKEFQATFIGKEREGRAAVEYLVDRILEKMPRIGQKKRRDKILAGYVKETVRRANGRPATLAETIGLLAVYVVAVFLLPYLAVYKAN